MKQIALTLSSETALLTLVAKCDLPVLAQLSQDLLRELQTHKRFKRTLFALTVPGCVHVCLRFTVGVGSSGICIFHVLILMSILVSNSEVL